MYAINVSAVFSREEGGEFSGLPPRRTSAAARRNMPITGPGIGKWKNSRMSSPMSWQPMRDMKAVNIATSSGVAYSPFR